MAEEIYVPTKEKIAAMVRTYIFDFTDFAELDAGETLVTPTVPSVSGLSTGSPSVSVAEIDDVAAGKGVTVSISGGTAGTTYTVDCRCTTSGNATLVRRLNLKVI